ncbi:YbaB/EbfC family nucleoid-associated protein [Actinoplanes sp. NPDC051411]|uniref:YbaB/EbfC family nucleoid-associated protein n=1 Tax=Actinoplanes sp. NPDC051411 TaxID=3155522 RepID=UPI00343ACE20
MIDGPIDDLALQRIEQWQQGFEERAAKARALNERTSGLTATAREGDGIVEVTVGSGGQIAGLRLDEEIRRQPATTTARQILDAIRSAKASLAREFERATAETVGLDSAAGQALMRSLNVRLGLADQSEGDE